MNIAIDIRLLGKQRTGDEMVFFHLTRELVMLDRENHYFLLTDETNVERLSQISRRLQLAGKENIQLISLPTRNRYTWNFWTLPRYFWNNQIDVFHTQYIIPFFTPKRTKIFTHIHDVSFRAFPQLIGWKDRLFLALLIPRSICRSYRVLATSKFTQAEIVKYYGVSPEKVGVLYNAIGDEFLQKAMPEDVIRVKKKYHLPEKYLLSVGTLQPRKNIPFLIRAFAQSKLPSAGYSLVLVGNRKAHHFDMGIDRAIKETSIGGRVIFPGFIESADLPALYAGARLFVFPSLYEGFGIPILEALSQGVPVACSDIPPFREIASSAAVFFNPHGIAGAAEILYNASIDDQWRERALADGSRTLSSFSWKESAKTLLSLFVEN